MQLHKGAILELEIDGFKIEQPFFILPNSRTLPILDLEILDHYKVTIDFQSANISMEFKSEMVKVRNNKNSKVSRTIKVYIKEDK